MRIKFLVVGVVFLFHFNSVVAQQDTAYVKTYPKRITTRLYGSQKYTALSIRDKSDALTLNYNPNTTFNIGVGATYKWATLNLAYGFGFLNREEEKGKTRYLDMQAHSYSLKLVTDLQAQFYKGFYLSPKGTATAPDNYYLRPDIRLAAIGLSIQYLFNFDRFSYRASYLQNELQKKSAGSLLVGGETYFGSIISDSTVVPSVINKKIANADIHRLSYFQGGPNVGYAYTFVYRQHLFFTAALSLSFSFGVSTQVNESGSISQTGFNPNSFLRLFAGYNTDKWAVSLAFINNAVSISTGDNDAGVQLNTGNFRINYVYRFLLSKKVRHRLNQIEKKL